MATAEIIRRTYGYGQPLLPDLYDRLKNFGTISSDYLQSIDRRMKKTANVIGFLSACQLPEPWPRNSR